VPLATIGASLRARLFLRYSLLNIYLLSNVAFTLGCYYVIHAYGYDSDEYIYFYYSGDAIPNVVGYLLIGSFFDRLLRESVFHKYVRPTLAIFFVLIVGISAFFIVGSVEHLYSEFVLELQQNLYFVGVLLTFLLWMSVSYLDVRSRRFTLLVSGLGIYFAAHAASYALWFLFPVLAPLIAVVPPLAYNFMVGLWLYTFLWVPEEEVAVQPARQVFQRLAPVGAHSLRK
ncbi:MAG: hypothetical protein IH916_09655, partial [Acidobacteria bacterium]|nr:hypothetical protein [Acidobacteriota bacterium]